MQGDEPPPELGDPGEEHDQAALPTSQVRAQVQDGRGTPPPAVTAQSQPQSLLHEHEHEHAGTSQADHPQIPPQQQQQQNVLPSLAVPPPFGFPSSDFVPLAMVHSRSHSQSRSNSQSRAHSPSRPLTSAEIDAVIANAEANAPPPPPPIPEPPMDIMNRSITPLMTNLLPAAVGSDGRVNLFVGNLPYRVRWQDLKDLFRKAGTVLRADVSLNSDNRSRGYGTVLMGSREDAARAIDRFNGFTWQTRTLEVRPDRLPPEYEAQPHHNHHHPALRPAMYTYHNMSGGGHAPFTLPGHLTPSHGPAWLPGQLPPPRPMPAFGQGPSSQHMFGGHSMPGMNLSPHPSHMAGPGISPVGPHSPTGAFGPGGLPLPLNGQNTGSSPFQPIGASPLAGSLSAGTSGPAGDAGPELRRGSLAAFVQSISPNASTSSLPRSASPAQPAALPMSRNASTQSHTGSRPEPVLQQPLPSRAHPPSHIGGMPPAFNAGRPGASPTESGHGPKTSSSLADLPIPPLALAHTFGMEGLVNKGAMLGPPTTLHDRVVFVTNLPVGMQWQDLKDFLRPAGIIIRADVATDPDGRSRGYGTALFASEGDAVNAVLMFDQRELEGRKISVHLERQSVGDASRRSSEHSQTNSASANNSGSQSAGTWQQASGQDQGTPQVKARSGQSANGISPVSQRVPWSLNTTSVHQQEQETPGRSTARYPDSTPQIGGFRHSHHPGPITMPSFQPMDSFNPLSPLQTRGLPPMTPSMPGFVFQAYPETPSVAPQGFLSPGAVGPFSPGLPISSPNQMSYNPLLNPAPGAPVQRSSGGSAQLGTPTTQAFPNNPIHGRAAGAIGSQSFAGAGDYFSTLSAESTPSRPGSSVSPLNAQDRLASSTTDVDELSRLTQGMSVDTQDGRDSPPTPTKARMNGFGGMTVSASAHAIMGQNEGKSSRISLDDLRPSTSALDVAWAGERRASYGDVVAGTRDKQQQSQP